MLARPGWGLRGHRRRSSRVARVCRLGSKLIRYADQRSDPLLANGSRGSEPAALKSKVVRGEGLTSAGPEGKVVRG